MNRSWSDRADKDLFFTILSVKSIGIISTTEWKTIGNHMRSMGYGFTNEGCRQHFQGLRRTQRKSAASAEPSPAASLRGVDPTVDPITRRPGPGRGRPRRSVSDPAQAAATPQNQPQVQQQQLPQFPPHMPPLQPHEPFRDGKPRVPHQDQPLAQIPHAPPVPESVMMPSQHEAPSATPASVTTHDAVSAPMSVPASLPTAHLKVEPPNLRSGMQSGVDEPGEHLAKRQILEEEQLRETLGNDPVLALTGHENTPDSYLSPTFNYAET